MITVTITDADLEAYRLFIAAGIISMCTDNDHNVVLNAGNQIILLAEKIKAQRSIVAMQK